MKKKLKNVDILDILVTVGIFMLVLALFELLMNNWLSAIYMGSIGILLSAVHYYSTPVAAKPAVVTPKKVTKPRKAWKMPKIPTLPVWVRKSAVRILALLLAILILALIGKGIWWALTGGTHAVATIPPPLPPIAVVALMKTNVVIVAPNNSGTVVGVNYGTINERPATAAPSQKLVSNEELADSIARLATKDEVARLATTAQASPSTNVVVIGNNNIVDSVITSVTTSDRPQLAPTRIPEPRLKAEFTETRVIINPGYYQTYVPPREYNSIYNYSRPIVIPQPQVIYQQPQVIYQQSYPIGMIVRGQPGPWGSRGPGWHR